MNFIKFLICIPLMAGLTIGTMLAVGCYMAMEKINLK